MTQIPKPASVIDAEKRATKRIAVKYCIDMFSEIKKLYNFSDQDWEAICTNAVECLEKDSSLPIEYYIGKCSTEFYEASLGILEPSF